MIIPLSNDCSGHLCERIHVVEQVLQVLLDTDPDNHRVIERKSSKAFSYSRAQGLNGHISVNTPNLFHLGLDCGKKFVIFIDVTA